MKEPSKLVLPWYSSAFSGSTAPSRYCAFCGTTPCDGVHADHEMCPSLSLLQNAQDRKIRNEIRTPQTLTCVQARHVLFSNSNGTMARRRSPECGHSGKPLISESRELDLIVQKIASRKAIMWRKFLSRSIP